MNYEYDGPQHFIDFLRLKHEDDEDSDGYFDIDHEKPTGQPLTRDDRVGDESDRKTPPCSGASHGSAEGECEKRPSPKTRRRSGSEGMRRTAGSLPFKRPLASRRAVPSRRLSSGSTSMTIRSKCFNNRKSGPKGIREPVRCDGDAVDFVSMLRRYRPLTLARDAGAKPKLTIPRPFNLNAIRNKSEKAQSEFRSMAQQVVAFQTKTPLRFRTMKPNAPRELLQKPANVAHGPLFGISPNLLTRLRNRPVTATSRAQLEDEEVEEMKSYKFRARPINPNLLLRADDLPAVQSKPNTTFQPFNLHTDSRFSTVETNKSDISEVTMAFHARPIPKGLFDKPKGVPDVQHRPVTATVIPSLVAAASRRPSRNTSSENSTDQSRWEPKPTKVQPFKFMERDEQRLVLKERKLQDLFEEERKLREFHANPAPKFCSFRRSRSEKSSTKPWPFDLSTENRGSKKTAKWLQELEDEARRLREAAVFRAKPCTVVHDDPFVPAKAERRPVVLQSFQLNTERRAEERAAFDEELRNKELEYCETMNARKMQLLREEELAIALMRAASVHEAQPIRRYKPLASLEKLPLTVPESPKLHAKDRKRENAGDDVAV